MASKQDRGGAGGDFSSPYGLQVSFVQPVKVSDHTEYVLQVSMGGKTWQCQRRYRQFDTLHPQLKQANARLPIPAVPEKKWFGNMSSTFVAKRQAGLQAYVDQLLIDPRWASMSILRAFFDTHRHMGPEADGGSGGADRAGSGGGTLDFMDDEATAQGGEGSSNTAQQEAEAKAAEEERLDNLVERAEKLMVEIYAAPPVLDATSAAEQILEVEEALSKRAQAQRTAIGVFRKALADACKGQSTENDAAAARDVTVAAPKEDGGEDRAAAVERGEGGDGVGAAAAAVVPKEVSKEVRDALYAAAQDLIEEFAPSTRAA